MLESASLTISDILFNEKRKYQFESFQLLILNLLFWGSFKPLSALNTDLEDFKNPFYNQTLTIVIFSHFLKFQFFFNFLIFFRQNLMTVLKC